MKRIQAVCSDLRSGRIALTRVGHWHRSQQRDGWLPKSQVEFVGGKEALIPVWLARKLGYSISTDSKLFD